MMRWLLAVSLLLAPLAAWANGGTFPDQGAAYAACTADAAALAAKKDSQGRNFVVNGGGCSLNLAGRVYSCYGYQVGVNASTACPVLLGNGFDGAYKWLAAGDCSARSALTSGWSSLGNGATCNAGCQYGPATSGERMTVAGMTYFSLGGAKPTGSTCAYGDGTGEQVTADKCVQQGSLTQCIKSDGRQCAVASSGKQFCWSPGEAGTKSSGNEGATKSPASANINPPKTPPANGGDWQQTGQATSSTTSGGTTTNYNVTGWGSSYGPQGSGGGGEGDGEGEGDGDGYGSPGEGVGDIYDKSDKTVDSVFSEFKGKVQEAPIFKSATGFLGGCSGGGQCPNETWDGGMWAGKFDLSQLCAGALGTLMNYAGFVFLAAMGAVGFRWALL
jgi:hypothetical protein